MTAETTRVASVQELTAAVDALPRITLARLPTPLERLRFLSKAWDLRDCWIKRDDLSGLAFGGNKARKLEFVIADAQRRGAKTLITGGRTQSNHTRDTAVAAKRVGMDAVALLSGTPPDPPTANVLLTQLMGVPIVWAKTDGEALRHGLTQYVRLKAQGKAPYVIPAGAANARGTVGYVNAVCELVAQCDAMDEPLPDVIVSPTGTGGTVAGLIAGCRLLGLRTRVVAIAVADPPYGRADRIAKLATQTCKLLGFKKVRFSPDDIPVDLGYLGQGYAKETPKSRAAIATMARLEGIFLDPTYSGKAMAGLHGLLEAGAIDRNERILFWHTGGMIGLFR